MAVISNGLLDRGVNSIAVSDIWISSTSFSISALKHCNINANSNQDWCVCLEWYQSSARCTWVCLSQSWNPCFFVFSTVTPWCPSLLPLSKKVLNPSSWNYCTTWSWRGSHAPRPSTHLSNLQNYAKTVQSNEFMVDNSSPKNQRYCITHAYVTPPKFNQTSLALNNQSTSTSTTTRLNQFQKTFSHTGGNKRGIGPMNLLTWTSTNPLGKSIGKHLLVSGMVSGPKGGKNKMGPRNSSICNAKAWRPEEITRKNKIDYNDIDVSM